MFERSQRLILAADSPGPAFPPNTLATAPDSLFALTLCGAFGFVHARYVSFHQYNVRTRGFVFTPHALLSRLAGALERVSLGIGHAPVHASKVIRMLQRVWDEQAVAAAGMDSGTLDPFAQDGVDVNDAGTDTPNSTAELPLAFGQGVPSIAVPPLEAAPGAALRASVPLCAGLEHIPGVPMLQPGATTVTPNDPESFWATFLASLRTGETL
jgi:hypothetical protein